MNIIIKQADKGGAVIIMNRDYYCNKVEDMLNNADIYVELEAHDDEKVMEKLKVLTIKYCSDLTEKGKDYLTNFNNRSSNVYGLPKIHRTKIILHAKKKEPLKSGETCSKIKSTFKPDCSFGITNLSHIYIYIYIYTCTYIFLVDK